MGASEESVVVMQRTKKWGWGFEGAANKGDKNHGDVVDGIKRKGKYIYIYIYKNNGSRMAKWFGEIMEHGVGKFLSECRGRDRERMEDWRE